MTEKKKTPDTVAQSQQRTVRQSAVARTRAEQASSEENKIYDSMVESLPGIFYLFDEQGAFLKWNRNLERVSGYSAEEISTMHPLDFFIGEGRRAEEEHIRTVLQAGSGNSEAELVSKDGRRTLFYFTCTRIVVGGRTCVIGTGSDITERKLMEESRRESDAKFRLLFHKTPIGLFTYDTRLRIIDCNDNFMDLVKSSREELIGLDMERLQDKGVLPAIREAAQGKEGFYEGPYWARTIPSGIWISMRTAPLFDQAGDIAGAVGIVEDMTKRELASVELKRNYDTQTVINSLLSLSLEDVPLDDILKRALDLILSIPWLDNQSRGAIFLVENESNTLVMKAQKRLAEPIQEACALVPFGKCICGRAALSQEIVFADSIDERHEIGYHGIIPHGHYCVPIKFTGRILGVINVYIKEGHNRDQKEEEILTAISNSLAGIILRRQAEEAVLERDELLRQAVNVSQIGIFDHDQRTGTIYWSPQQRVIHGWGQDEPVNLQVFVDLVHPEDRESIASSIQRAHDPAGDGIWDVEHRIIRRDGAVRWLRERSQTFFEGEGKARRPVRTIGAVLDITDRKNTEEEQQKLVSVIEMSRDFIGISDLTGRVLYLNEAGLRLVGIDNVEESRTKSIQDFLVEADQRRLEKEILPTVFGTGTWIGELALRHFKTGMLVPVDMNLFIIKDAKRQEPIAFANISRDIAERKNAEGEKQKLQSQLLHAQRMEAVGQLSGGIAHDFNNILSAISGYGQILQMKMKEDDPLRVNVDHLLEAADRAAYLTHSLLAFSRKQVLAPRHVDLKEIVRQVEKLLSRVIGEDIDLKTVFRQDRAIVNADIGQIEQVLMNLATNARDAMPAGGSFTLELDTIDVDDLFIQAHGFGEPGRYAVVSAADTGPGMDEETRARVFEPFFTTKEVGRGTGLGLSMVYGIVKQHHGFINVYSEPGKGSIFKIYLPLVRTEREKIGQATDVNEERLPRGTETILIAEDDAALRKLSRVMLEEFGYTVIVAEDGEDAVRKFSERGDEIQMIILDMIMPRKSGKETYDEIQKIRPGVKALFVSGYTADKIRLERIPGERVDLLLKPLSPRVLVRKVREILDKRSV